MVGQTMQWGNIRFTIGLIVVIHLEKFLYVFFATGRNTLDMQSLYTGSSCPLFYFVQQLNDINNYECEPSFI